MTNKAEPVNFQSPPSEANVHNVVSSLKGTLYLNKPKYHVDEIDTVAPEVPVDDTTATPPGGEPSNPKEPTHDWAKRYADLKSFHDKAVNAKDAQLAENARLIAERDAALEQAKRQPVELPTTEEELEAFKTKYGHLYNVMRTVALKESTSTKTEFEAALKKNEKITRDLQAEKAFQHLLELHPDAVTLRVDSEFIKWVDEQIPAVKALIESDKVPEVARGLDIYKKDKGLITKTKGQKADEAAKAAAQVVTKSQVDLNPNPQGKIWKASEVSKITRSKYHLYEADILKALAEGRYRENE